MKMGGERSFCEDMGCSALLIYPGRRPIVRPLLQYPRLTNWKLNLVYITLMTSLGNPLGNQSNNFLNQILSINIKLIHLPLQTNGYKIVDSNLLT